MLFKLIFLLFPLSVFASDVLDFWLGSEQIRIESPGEKSSIWFRGGENIDQEINTKFGKALHEARYGKLDHLKATPKGRLELIIILDQFSRNIYRSLPESFANDSYALSLALEGIAQGFDEQLLPIERLFFYMPLQHAEDIEIQRLSIVKYEQLVEESDAIFRPIAERALSFALLHKNIIDQFGRFPHRSKVLNREPTEYEIAFLSEENSSF